MPDMYINMLILGCMLATVGLILVLSSIEKKLIAIQRDLNKALYRISRGEDE